MIKLSDIIKETKFDSTQILYHYTTLLNLLRILKSNKLIGREKIIYNPKLDKDISIYEFSFSRSKDYLYTKSSERWAISTENAFVLDAEKLSNNYKLVPHSHKNNEDYYDNNDADDYESYDKHKHHEYEERLYSKNETIPNIKQYIKKIILSDKRITFDPWYVKMVGNETNYKFPTDDEIDIHIIQKYIEDVYHIEVEIIKLHDIKKSK